MGQIDVDTTEIGRHYIILPHCDLGSPITCFTVLAGRPSPAMITVDPRSTGDARTVQGRVHRNDGL